ncbi:hypothetical protein 2050HW_00120 [Serratia phage vB_SmaM_ 2050HW]|uniref:Peptidase S74 domain-containing protein n=1 Tax=Serratia phage vB_SmaM_ 2050HW TaxID=2024252 RepID=A0A289Z7B8_9CAUD|nr:tail protein [Serratia phage vB_SmaM_ 2050HW]ATA65455.1 hypothetical protein 2050HW_00120 [Serratia phage vB_SmaM_ 2050HW]
MSDNDLQLRITELPKLDHFDSNSVLPAVGRSQGTKMTGKVNFREMRSYFDLSNAYETIKDGVDATKLGDTFFVYSDGTKVFANEYQNIGGAATPIQDPKEGVIYYPTRMGIVGSLAAGATVGSFDELRNTRPLKEGVSIYLSSYYKGLNKGGGEFIGYYGKRADDGGMVAGDGNNYYWVRNANFVTPEMFGAYGTPDKDDSAAIEGALNSGLDVQFDGSATYIANRTLVLKSIKWQQFIDGNGAWIKYSDKSRGLINEIDANGVTQRYTKFRSFFNLNLQGPATKNSKWNDVNQCDALCISYGVVENCNFYGWSNALRGFGEAYVNNCFGDDLRTAMFSCYDPGHNEITNSSVGWCSGDAIILKGGSGKAHNVDIVYAGCIDKNNEDGATALPGCIVSCGADGAGSQNIQISNISCQYFGCAGLNIQGDGVTVSGDMNLGSIYEDNFQYANQAAALWIGAKNFTIGNLHFNKVHVGVGINGNCANGSIGKIRIMSKTNLAGSTLFSATDGPNSQITKVIVDAIDFLGASTINNDVYINTDGLYLKSFYIQSLNNLQGGYTVALRKNARIGKMILAATTSASTSPVMLIESDSVIDELEFRRNFGTALVVENNARPAIKRLSFQYKQGIAAPFIIKGDGTMTLNWGDVDMFGPSVARPQIAGKLVMNSYQGPTFRPFDAAVYAGVSVPNRVFQGIEEMRMVGPSKEGDTAYLSGYYLNSTSTLGSGTFIGHIGAAPVADDKGCLIVGNGYWWERIVAGPLDVFMFGAKGDFNVTTQSGTDDSDSFISTIAAAIRLNYRDVLVPAGYNYYLTKTINPGGVGYRGNKGVAIRGGSTANTNIFFNPATNGTACFEILGGSGIHSGREVSGFTIQPVNSKLYTGVGIRYAGCCFVRPANFNIIMKFDIALHLLNDQGPGVFTEYNNFFNWRLHRSHVDVLFEVNGGDNSFHGNSFYESQIQVKTNQNLGDGNTDVGIGIELRGVTAPAYWYDAKVFVDIFGGPGAIGMKLTRANTDHLIGGINGEGDLIFQSTDTSAFELAGDLRSIGKVTWDVAAEPTTGRAAVYIFNNRISNESNFTSPRMNGLSPRLLNPSLADRTDNGSVPAIFRATKLDYDSICNAVIGLANNRHLWGYIPPNGNLQSFVPGAALSFDGTSFTSYSDSFIIGTQNRTFSINGTALFPSTTGSLTLGQSQYRWSSIYLNNFDIDSNGINPVVTNAMSIGSTSKIFKDIYLQNAPTVVSDEKDKDEVSEIPPEVIAAWGKINFSQWKMKTAIDEKGEKARLHVGVIAQDIQKAFQEANLDATDYGILIIEKDEDENEQWMVRMDECLVLEAAYQRSRLDEIEKLLKGKK